MNYNCDFDNEKYYYDIVIDEKAYIDGITLIIAIAKISLGLSNLWAIYY